MKGMEDRGKRGERMGAEEEEGEREMVARTQIMQRTPTDHASAKESKGRRESDTT